MCGKDCRYWGTVNVAINVVWLIIRKMHFLGSLLSLLFETIFRSFVLNISIKKQIKTQRIPSMVNIARKKGREG